MKIKLIFITILFWSCNRSTFSGKIHDFDTNEPIENVSVNINNNTMRTDSSGYFNLSVNSKSDCIMYLKKEEYANKAILRKPDNLSQNRERNVIYMFKKESDFSSIRR